MTKQEAVVLLLSAGIEYIGTAERKFSFDELSFVKKYNGVECEDDIIIPTKEQYIKIISIVGEAGLKQILSDMFVFDMFCIWTSSEKDKNTGHSFYFYSGSSIDEILTHKALGLNVPLWRFKEDEKDKEIKKLKDIINDLQKQLNSISSEL